MTNALLLRRIVSWPFILAYVILIHLTACGTGDENKEKNVPITPMHDFSATPPETLIFHWYMGKWFEVPMGYISPPMSKSWKRFDKMSTIKSLAEIDPGLTGYDANTGEFDASLLTRRPIPLRLSFCSPSLGYVNKNDRGSAFSKEPCNEDNDKIIHMQIIWPFLGGAASSFATKEFRVANERRAEAYRLGAKAFWENHNDKPDWAPNKSTHSFEVTERDLSVLIRCSPGRNYSNDKQRICRGTVWEKQSNLVLSLSFDGAVGEREVLDHWRLPVQEALTITKKLYVGSDLDGR